MKSRRQDRVTRAAKSEDLLPSFLPPKRGSTQPLKAKNENQKRYMNSINANTVTFGTGPAGTGKTFLAAWKAADAFEEGLTRKIYITRPIVEAGESIGFLPGEMEEKIDPYFAPVKEALIARLGTGATDYMLKSKQVEFVPLAFMRGRSFADAWIIADEMQNSTPKQMKMFLTRIAEGSRMIINGDLLQQDIQGPNGLFDAIDRLQGVHSVGVVRFTRDDVVRSGMAKLIVEAYEGDDAPALPRFITGPVDAPE